MEKARQAYDEWKQADARAREAEGRLSQAWDTYFETRTSPPPAELIQEVSRLRAVANDRLTVAMLLMGSKPRVNNDDTNPGPRT